MSLAVFVGLFGPMGSGKSYEAMEFHLLPAIKRRQIVATNIDGVFEEPQQKAIASFTGLSLDEVKSLLIKLPRTREELFSRGVLPDPLDWSIPSLVPPGSLIVLDECSTLLDKPLPDYAMRYITEQRHGVDANGNTGRTVIISQSPDIHRSLRRLMSSAFVFSKFSMLAPFMKWLRPFKIGADYRAEIYTDMSKTIGRGKPDNLITRRYNSAVFPCYKSYDASHAQELGVDKRTTLLGNRYVMLFIPFMLLLALYSGFKLFERFGAVFSSSDAPPSVSSPSPPSSPSPASSSVSSSVSSASSVKSFDSSLSSKYRLVGYYASPVPVYILADNNNKLLYTFMSDVDTVNYYGSLIVLNMRDGSRVTFYSGSGVSNAKNSSASSTSSADR